MTSTNSSAIGTAEFAIWIECLYGSMAVVIGLFIGAFCMLGINSAPKSESKRLSLSTELLMLIGCMWLNGSGEE